MGFEYRVADREAWTNWLRQVRGHAEPVLEVVQHRLRVADQGAPALPAEPSVPIIRVRPGGGDGCRGARYHCAGCHGTGCHGAGCRGACARGRRAGAGARCGAGRCARSGFRLGPRAGRGGRGRSGGREGA